MKDEDINQETPPQEVPLSIYVDENLKEGIYSNFAAVMHLQSEFLLDFIRLLPDQKQHQVKSRIVMTPDNAKRLAHMLMDNVAEYERIYGTINIYGSEPAPQEIIIPRKPKGKA